MSNNIFVQLGRCQFDKDISVEECRVLVTFYPKPSAKAIKFLLNNLHKKIECDSCKDEFPEENYVTDVTLGGEELKFCEICYFNFLYGDRNLII